jgi:hypothetical protein
VYFGRVAKFSRLTQIELVEELRLPEPVVVFFHILLIEVNLFLVVKGERLVL